MGEMRIAECGLRNVDPSIRSGNACFKMGSRNRAQGLFRVSHLKIHIPQSAFRTPHSLKPYPLCQR